MNEKELPQEKTPVLAESNEREGSWRSSEGRRGGEEKVRRIKIPSRSRLPVHQCLSP